MDKPRPYFLWDYDLTEDDVHRILHGKNEVDKNWLIGRILTHARYEDVWQYLTLSEVVKTFPKLRLRPNIKTMWRNALQAWGYHV